jgi:hypothetical protein
VTGFSATAKSKTLLFAGKAKCKKGKTRFRLFWNKSWQNRSVFPALSLEKGDTAFCLFRKFQVFRRKVGFYFSPNKMDR